ncbi:MAG: YmdB family metallophosphoesterase [Treponema sp.]|jgi:metallophosphoesterase (TIGR00282 family)|nr:YmdB family metallophosphoesterase [Treponema sp.]
MHDESVLVRALMIGDVVGEAGLEALERLLPGLIREQGADFVAVNGENAADGFGMTEAVLGRILAAGADTVTSGNHVWEKREFWPILEQEPRILRPANYPEGCPGQGWVTAEKAGVLWAVVNLQGRELLPPIDCPFKTFDRIASAWPSNMQNPLVLVDFHAESTREKESLGYYLDGRAALVAGTHTHVLTADERILPQGTGYITDLGMTGVPDGIIGMDTKICLDRARTQVLYRMVCAQGAGSLRGIAATINRETKKTVSITRIDLR